MQRLAILILVLTISAIESQQTGGGTCNESLQCSLQGGRCERGKCLCWDGRSCPYCEGTALSNHCVPPAYLMGGPCVTNKECNGNGVCAKINSTYFACTCFDGWLCPSCGARKESYLSDPSNFKCPSATQIVDPYGGGACRNGFDCGNWNGQCINGTCKCHTNRICEHCQVRIWNYEDIGCPNKTAFGGAKCNTFRDCSPPNGTCVKGRCSCTGDFMCQRCELSIADYLKSDSVCPDPKDYKANRNSSLPAGGGLCESNSDCNYPEGGFCGGGFCSCFDGWACDHCHVRVIQNNPGFVCPSIGAHNQFFLFLFAVLVSVHL